MASGYADGHDAHSRRSAPLFPLRGERVPLDPTQDFARAPTLSRLAHRVTRPALSRLTPAFVDHCLARSPEPPAAMGLDLAHSADPTQGQQAFPFSHHHSQRYGSVPRCIFAGTSHALVTACLRPGKRPPGRANALLVGRLLASLRRPWPSTPLLVRGASPVATPAVREVLTPRRRTDVVFGRAGPAVLLRHAGPVMQEARDLCRQQTAVAHADGEQPPPSRRVSEDCASAAASWPQPWRGIVKAAGLAAGDKPRCVVTSGEAPTPQHVYADLYGARGHGDNDRTAVQCDRHSARPSATTCLATAVRRLLACGADGLHPARRTQTLAPTGLATAQPRTVILTLCQVATQLTQYKDRMLLPLPTSCPVKGLLQRVATWLTAIPVPALHPSEGQRHPPSTPGLLRRARALAISPADSVGHRPRLLQGRGAPGGRTAAASPGPTTTRQRVPPRNTPSPLVCPDVNLPPRTGSATVYEISRLGDFCPNYSENRE